MITGAFGYHSDYPEAMSQREAAERQKSMYAREDALRNSLSPEVKQRPQGGVAREMQHFEKHLNSLINVIDELDRRLAVATVPQPETNNSLQGSDQTGSALTCQLSSFNTMLSRQINRLEAIYQGVDL